MGDTFDPRVELLVLDYVINNYVIDRGGICSSDHESMFQKKTGSVT